VHRAESPDERATVHANDVASRQQALQRRQRPRIVAAIAEGRDEQVRDIDLMIISDSLTYGEIFGSLERVTRAVGRKVNPTVYTAAEFSKRAGTENAFVTRVLEQPKLWVIGSEHDLPIAA